MGRKNAFAFEIASDQSLATNFVTAPTVVRNQDNCAYQINVSTVDSAGTFAVQASIDYAINETTNTVENPGTWIDLTLAGGVPAVSATSTDIIINLNQLPFEAIRLAYTSNVAGTGTCEIYVFCKNIGA